MIVNPYCKDLGWLLEDLKRAFVNVPQWSYGPWIECSEEPITEDRVSLNRPAYIALRSWEITPDTPHPELHIVQFHSLEPRFAGDPATLNRCAAFVFVHPDQPAMLERLGVSLDRPCLLRPIGAPEGLRLRESLPETFTVGWCGRDTGAKRVGLFVEAVAELVRQGIDCRASLLGASLGNAHTALVNTGVETIYRPRESDQPYILVQAQEFYEGLDALCITSAQETGPMPLFEALACGVPVACPIYTGWQEPLGSITGGVLAYMPEGPATLAVRLLGMAGARQHEFDQRYVYRAAMSHTLESWIEANVRLAMEVANG